MTATSCLVLIVVIRRIPTARSAGIETLVVIEKWAGLTWLPGMRHALGPVLETGPETSHGARLCNASARFPLVSLQELKKKILPSLCKPVMEQLRDCT